MTPKMKNAILIGGFSLLALVAALGWARKPEATVNAFAAPNAAYPTAPVATYGQAAPQAEYPQANMVGQPMATYAQNCVDPPVATNVAYAPVEYRTYRAQPRVIRRYVEPQYDRERVVVREKRGRSLGKSVAIVGGSAGAGAAIGALAGGGKGAAIGALSGGAAGFIYDRLTHNK
jgi:hypothetical protein